MPFLKKLGNAFEDAASFAIPAGLALGATALTGGNPMAGGSVLSALGAGAGGFKRNEEEERLRKMQLQQNKNQGMANLINQLSSRPNYQAKQAAVPSAGFLEQLAGGAQTGIQAYQMADAMKQQRATQDRQNQILDMQLAGARGGAQRALGADAANSGGKVQATVTGSYNQRSPVGAVRTMGLMDTAPPTDVVSGFQEQTRLNQQMAEKARQEAEDRLLKNLNIKSQIDAREADTALSQDRFGLDQQRLGMDRQRLGMEGQRLDLSQQAQELERERFGLEQKRFQQDLNEFRERQAKQLSDIEIAASDRIVAVEPRIKTAAEVAANYGKVQGLADDLLSDNPETRGAGQVTLVNIYNRGFVDEGVAVRKEDQDLLREAQSSWDSVMSEVQRMETGMAFSPELVRNIRNSAELLYRVYANSLLANVQMRLDSTPGLQEDQYQRIQRFLLAPILMLPPGSSGPEKE